MAMPERVRADAADQVDEPVPVGVLDDRSQSPLDRDSAGEREALQPRREMLLFFRDDRLALRPGDRGFDVRGGELQVDPRFAAPASVASPTGDAGKAASPAEGTPLPALDSKPGPPRDRAR